MCSLSAVLRDAQALTAENSQDETSELFIGEWMEQRGIRDQIVLATKVSTNHRYL